MKKYLFGFLLFSSLAYGQSPVTNSASYGEELPSGACLACPGADWFNPENITSPDGNTTTSGLNNYGNCFMSTCFYSRFLYAHHFNFDIPPDATIDSIFVDIKRAARSADAIQDSIVQLQKSSMAVGENSYSPDFWTTKLTYESYGHNNPLWGTTWLPADLNDTASGVLLKIINKSDSIVQAEVDHIQMTVHFSTSTGNYSVTSSPSDIEWKTTPGEIEMNIYTSTSENCSSIIYNSGGQKLISNQLGRSIKGQNHFVCSTGDLMDGIYIMVLNIGKKSYSRKFAVIN